ncbi:lysis protein [Leclercia sp. S52]|uniref:lysis protein n=1 Tax=Leclercia sp. S52 TaxID=3138178 RepID=UPI003219C771
MTFNLKTMGIGLLLVTLLVMSRLVSYYHAEFQKEERRADAAEQNLRLANATITDMETRQRNAAALDAKYTGELADAKETIERLHSDVIAGRKRLQLNANCSANGTTSSSGMGDASSPRLTDSAERDYFTLRERIVTINGQVNYLQDYIRMQCQQ